MEWLRKHPIAAFLPLQALLCFWNLGLLSPWMDEAITLLVVRLPVRQILSNASRDVHPPVYYLLVDAWQRLPLGLDWAVQARALSFLPDWCVSKIAIAKHNIVFACRSLRGN